jgi:GNAT superfamily N-acetyltransferase
MTDAAAETGDKVGLLWHWRRGDALPQLASPSAEWRTQATGADDGVAGLGAQLARDFALPEQFSRERFALGHRLYLGLASDQPVAYGWLATGPSSFGEPSVHFVTPPGHAYLYDFVTLPSWRGRGCYPALLRAIIDAEPAIGDFWIIHHITNLASQRGIAHAGFQIACSVYRTVTGSLALCPAEDRERAKAGAALLALPLLPRR